MGLFFFMSLKLVDMEVSSNDRASSFFLKISLFLCAEGEASFLEISLKR